MDKISLNDGHLSLKGTTTGGKSYELTGEVEEVRIEVDREYEDVFSWDWSTPKYLVSDETYWIKLKRKEDGEAYRVQMETVDILREAWLPMEENSFKAVVAARALCGAPEEATVYVNESYVGFGVKFTWTDKVVK